MGAFLKGREARTKNSYLLLIEYAMKFLAIVALLIYTIAGTGIVILNVDPFGRYISRYFSLYLPSLILLPVRIVLILLLGSELYRVFMTYLFIAIILLVTLNNTLQNLIKCITETSLQRSKIRISRLILFMKAVDAFRALEIYFKKNEFAYAATIPIIIYFSSTLIVLSNYCTIKLYGVVFPAEYFMFPAISMCVVIFVLTVVPEATNIHERSLNLHWNVAKLTQTKYGKATVRSLRVFGMNATFFMMTNSIRQGIIEYQLNYTINLLLSL